MVVIDLLVVGVKGGIVHEPLQAAIGVSGICAVVVKSYVDGLSRRRWSTGTIGVQGYGLLERILSSRSEE